MGRYAGIKLLVTAVFVSACAAPAPTPKPESAVHFRNHSGSALMVGVASGDTNSLAVLRPCGGDASLMPWPPGANYPWVFASAQYDETGVFDELVEDQPAGTIDPDTVGYLPFSAIIWSRGNIAFADLPIWVTFNAGTTDIASAAPTNTAPPRCDPWPPSE